MASAQRGLTSGAAAAVLVLLVVGCGSSKSKTATATSAAAAAGAGSSAAVKAATTKLGQVLVNAQGMTLYTFDPENSGTIACLSGCVGTWPPDLVASGGSAPSAGAGVTVAVATIARPDGGTQVTAGGHPLYAFSGDKAAGDTNGDGIGGKWHVAHATGSSAGTTATTAAASKY